MLETKKCPNCGFENKLYEKTCGRCGWPFKIALMPDDGRTRPLEITPARPQSRWGTARLGATQTLRIYVRGYDVPLEVKLAEAVILGRFDVETGESPEVALDTFKAKECGVSRRHAKIYLDEGALKVVDLGSANYTFMNGQKLIAHQPRILRDGDELRLGRLICRISFG